MEQQNRGGILMRGFGRHFVFSRFRAWLGKAFEVPRLLRGVRAPDGAICLDIATGLGWASAGMLRRDPSARVVSLDYDEAILPRTRDYLRSQGAARPAVCRADAKHLPFRDASFDLVFCLYGLHHFRGYLEGLREIARVLKSEGTFALIDPVRKPGMPPGGHHGTDVPTGEELRRMLGESGFDFAPPRTSLGSAKVVAHKAGPAGGAL
ncbi:MAG: class I SAM-dependent methyltransferase [Candidatus Binataceae bacterium]